MKRFYKDVTLAREGDGWQVLLDNRPIRTVGQRPQVVPTRALAEAMADEWRRQGEEIGPTGFVLRDLADYAIDIAGPDRAAVVAGLLRFAETDTLCYRADPEEPLYRRQLEQWEPMIAGAERRWDVRFERVCGIVHKPQPPETLAKLREVLEELGDFELSALNTLASLAASLIIGLAALAPVTQAEKLWAAANLEEDWQAEQWGWEWEAEEKRAQRLALFAAAKEFARLASDTGAGPN